MYDICKDLLDAYASSADVLPKLLEGVTDEQAQAARGGDEDWSIIEVLCHMRDAEQRALERFRAMRDEDEPFLEGYDQDAWAKERDYASYSLAPALAEFLQVHASHLQELTDLPFDK